MRPLKPQNDPVLIAELRDRSWTDAQRQVADVMANMTLAEQVVFTFNQYGLSAACGFMRAKRDRAAFREAAAMLRKVPAFKLLADIAAVAAEMKPVTPSWRTRLNGRARRRMEALRK
jgi:hypothetical protein